jgi:hypothetical protein
MKTSTRKPIFLTLTLLFSLLLLASLACSLGGISVDKDSATVDITLKENQVNELLKNSNLATDSDPDRLLDKITSVEMHDGYMRIFGTGKTPAGEEVEGSFDVSVGVENDILQVQIIAVDMAGLDMNDPRIEKTNQELVKALTESVTESNGEVQYKEASITEDALNLKVQVNFQNK